MDKTSTGSAYQRNQRVIDGYHASTGGRRRFVALRNLHFPEHFHNIGNVELLGAMMDIGLAVEALAALAQESRLAIFRLLVQAGREGIAAGALGEKLGIPPATLSFHLKNLSHARLIGSRTEGRYVIYSANYNEMNKLIDYLTEHCCAGEAAQCSTSKPC